MRKAPPDLRMAARGFTLIELLVVLAIVGILIVIAGPDMTQFIADQRVRGVTSDLYHDLTLARAQAISLNRRVCLVPSAAGLTGGWAVIADTNPAPPGAPDSCLDPTDEVLSSAGPVPTRIQILANPAGALPTAAVPLAFLPDGSAEGVGIGPMRGITVCDNLGDANLANNKVRTIFFGLTGRMNIVEQDPDGVTLCN